MLLAVTDLFAEGGISSNLVMLDPELCALFGGYWLRVMPHDWHGDIGLPFYHLGRDGFWHLEPRPGSEHILSAGHCFNSIRQLHDHTLGASLDDALFSLLHDQEARDLLRAALIETHFAPETYAALLDQGRINVEAFAYSQKLLEQARQDKALAEREEPPEPVRNQGFRRAAVTVYGNRCAFCGLRVQTFDSHSIGVTRPGPSGPAIPP